jgi:uncharacterized protein (TIGR03437 family)
VLSTFQNPVGDLISVPFQNNRTRFHAILCLTFALLLASVGQAGPAHQQEVTPAAAGPFHVDQNQIVDAKGHAFLMRGTQLTAFHLATVTEDNRGGSDFGPHSATSLTALRLRFNMNTARLPLDIREAANPEYFQALSQVVKRANQLELLVVLSAREPGADLPTARSVEFWTRCAATFKDYPNVFFGAFSDPSPAGLHGAVDAHSAAGWKAWRAAMSPLVEAIRATGAIQPIVLTGWNDERMFEGAPDQALLRDPNIVYEAPAHYATTTSGAQREARFASLAKHAPVTTNGWDLELDNPAACAALSSDPTVVSEMIQRNLEDLDARRISWTMSVFQPGKLIKDLSLHDATSLENGWTCGPQKYPAPGLGRVVEGHLRATEERSLFVVSAAGGVDLPRGGFANGYGPVMAERDSLAKGPGLPLSLGGIEAQITDAAGVTRPAPIIWVTAGWGQINLVIPEESAVGPARMTLVRKDGSRLSTNITIADTAPGFRTGLSCRGAAIGTAVQQFASGRSSKTELATCDGHDCSTLVVPMNNSATTKVILRASGFRHAASAADIQVTIAGQRVPVLSYGPADDQGMDQLTLAIPASLRGIGETDLEAHLNGRVSNVVRIRIGG